MKIIKPSVEILEQGPGIEGIYKAIEQAGRNCYQSSHLIGEDTAKPFVERMIRDGHTAMLEHGTVYLQMPLDEWLQDFRVEVCPGRTHVVTLDETNSAFITTNYRVLVEHDALDLLKYLCEKPEPMHERRVTARFNTQIAISREYNRHRVDSIAEESTRYCNYSKDKYSNEIKINLPTWIDEPAELPTFEDLVRGIEFGDHHKDWTALDWWLMANTFCEHAYMQMTELGWQAQQARTILPLDTNTVLVHTAFVSDWQHFFDLRSRGTTGKPHPDAKVLADHLLLQFIERGYIHE
jgi:thymidylate synthase (FAD)